MPAFFNPLQDQALVGTGQEEGILATWDGLEK